MASGTRAMAVSGKPVPRVLSPGRSPRVCPVCGERLSSYNPGPNCYSHTIDLPWRGPTPNER